MAYLNEWQKRVDARLAALEIEVFGRAQGPDGTLISKEEFEREQKQPDPGAPATYQQPKPGVNRAARKPKP